MMSPKGHLVSQCVELEHRTLGDLLAAIKLEKKLSPSNCQLSAYPQGWTLQQDPRPHIS